MPPIGAVAGALLVHSSDDGEHRRHFHDVHRSPNEPIPLSQATFPNGWPRGARTDPGSAQVGPAGFSAPHRGISSGPDAWSTAAPHSVLRSLTALLSGGQGGVTTSPPARVASAGRTLSAA